MAILFVGIDLAKNVFALHGVGATGLAELVRPSVRRAQLLELVASLPPCTIGMEACSGAHHWARQFQQYGHTVRPIAPGALSPERATRQERCGRCRGDLRGGAAPMRFVPIKSAAAGHASPQPCSVVNANLSGVRMALHRSTRRTHHASRSFIA